MGVIDFAQYLNSAVAAGQAVEGTAVRVLADNGAEIGQAVYKVIDGGNGVSQEVAIATTTAAGGGTITTGMAFMAVDLGVLGMAIAPALGIEAGISIYETVSGDSQFRERLREELLTTGKTIGGKAIAYWNGENFYADESVIETYKKLLVEYGAFIPDRYVQSDEFQSIDILNHSFVVVGAGDIIFLGSDGQLHDSTVISGRNYQSMAVFVRNDTLPYSPVYFDYVLASRSALSGGDPYTHDGRTAYYARGTSAQAGINAQKIVTPYNGSYLHDVQTQYAKELAWIMLYGQMTKNDYLQDDATYPTYDEDFPLTYPTWTPYEYPQTVEDPSELPKVYPLKYPGVGDNPYPTQDPAQNPEPENVPDTYPVVIPDLNIPEPTPDPWPGPDPAPDPDPQPDPDPIPTPDPPPTSPDPVDPNPTPPPSTPIVPVTLPDTVDSNKLFTVYNPTASQLDSLGGYLWDASLMAQLRDIWQDPLDGIISLIQVYATPSTSGSHNIILGYLDSGVGAAVVSSQFTTIDCGTIDIDESKMNATDYAPYTSLHLFLPFIGFVELDTAECMNGSITVTYKVDVYTGTCLAEISITRTEDMPEDPIIYTYSGNCSQQLPLTSGNATGVLSALIGGITAGLSVASGGGLGIAAGMAIAGQSVTHEMFHVAHSGNISANAGIMGQKKPYLIIGRRHGYDANGYNTFYGFPANKTIMLGNHTGFAKIKKCWLHTSATNKEYNMILNALQEGVIL